MKRYLFIALLICSSMSMFAEYALINKIVYSLSLGTLEAKVLNFQTNSPEVTIPPYVTYRGDKYKVTSLSYYAFDTDAYKTYRTADLFSGGNEYFTEYAVQEALENEKKEAPFRYDYKYVREGIVQLNLPNTITTISDEAFNGMRRLKNLTLPSSIQYFVTERGYETLLHNMTRLEKLVVLGAPVLYEVREETVEIPVGNGYKRERQTIIDTVNISSKNEKGEYIYKVKLGLRLGIDHCPNIQSYEVPQFDKFMVKIEANRQIFDNYNQLLVEVAKTFRDKVPNSTIEIRTPQIDNATLIDTALMGQGYRDALNYLLARSVYASYDLSARDYKRQLDSALHEHPYYDGTEIDYLLQPIDEMETDAEVVKNAFVILKNDMDEQYNSKINGGMEKNLHDNYPSQYVKSYCSIHPEMKNAADSIIKEYRCYKPVEQSRFVIEFLKNGSVVSKSCRESCWRMHSELFDYREDFDEKYDNTKSNTEFDYEIMQRQDDYSKLSQMQTYAQTHSKDIKLSNINKKPNEATRRIINNIEYFKKSYYYSRAVKYLIQTFPKVLKEYEKNGSYFASELEFFEAYSSDSYSKILKDKKSK